ncbi:hypothetical protein DFP92_1329 [Yoonia sediminilitoris]|uniref:Uncharacterized protein n=2 Tax=Yoonia sediminilitoris TaxID=1286148 RepID=A0A2T6K1D1_9RHOB|nr:hypothetical protein C8N45_1329 [Yoonia sediminilitoris]RCW89464.1 hypothetical protein DFP92_1329 [Yoonia sediminilitoris]
MIDVLLLMLPIFTMIAIGSLFVWRGWFPAHGLPRLNRFVMNACIPVLLFSAISNGESLSNKCGRLVVEIDEGRFSQAMLVAGAS